MNSTQGKSAIIFGCTAAVLGAMIQPVWAADTEITTVQLNPTAKGVELVLGAQGDARPPIFTVNRGNLSISDVSNAVLRLPQAGDFEQREPAPGIRSVQVRQLDANTVRITVEGIHAAPIAEVLRQDNRRGVLAVSFDSSPNAGIPSSSQTSSQAQPSAVPPFQTRAGAHPWGISPLPPSMSIPNGSIWAATKLSLSCCCGKPLCGKC